MRKTKRITKEKRGSIYENISAIHYHLFHIPFESIVHDEFEDLVAGRRMEVCDDQKPGMPPMLM